MRLSIIRENSGWIIDEIADDYARFTRHDVVDHPDKADLVWYLNPWDLPHSIGSVQVPAVATIHHVAQDKHQEYAPLFNAINSRNIPVITPNKHTVRLLGDQIKTPVTMLPYWVLSTRRGGTKNTYKIVMRQNADVVIGSFQKDSNKDGSPKLSKGPDLLVEVITKVHKMGLRAHVCLSGYNRSYVESALLRAGISSITFARHPDIRELYDSVDWCLVNSRDEGGPQAVLEAAYRQVKILSTDCGMASAVLHTECICNTAEDFVVKIANGVDHRTDNYLSALGYVPEKVIPQYDDFFEKHLASFGA